LEQTLWNVPTAKMKIATPAGDFEAPRDRAGGNLVGKMKLATPAGDVDAPRDRAGGSMVGKATGGGWERGPRGGMRRRVGNKWVYGQSTKGTKSKGVKHVGKTRSGKGVPPVPHEHGELDKKASAATHEHGLFDEKAHPAISASQKAQKAHFESYTKDWSAQDHEDAMGVLDRAKWADDVSQHHRFAHNGVIHRHGKARDEIKNREREEAYKRHNVPGHAEEAEKKAKPAKSARNQEIDKAAAYARRLHRQGKKASDIRKKLAERHDFDDQMLTSLAYDTRPKAKKSTDAIDALDDLSKAVGQMDFYGKAVHAALVGRMNAEPPAPRMEGKMSSKKKSKATRAREHVYAFLGLMTGKQGYRTSPKAPKRGSAARPIQGPTTTITAAPPEVRRGPVTHITARPPARSGYARMTGKQGYATVPKQPKRGSEARPIQGPPTRITARPPEVRRGPVTRVTASPPPRAGYTGRMSGKITAPSDYAGRMHGKQQQFATGPKPPKGQAPRQPRGDSNRAALQEARSGYITNRRGIGPARMTRSEGGWEMDMRKGGLWSFEDNKNDDRQALPDAMLPEYLAAFVEEALEHEKKECEHRKVTPKADEDLHDWWAKRIMSELVQYMRKNKDLARAAKGKTFKHIAGILRSRGLMEPQTKTATPTDRDSMHAMNAVIDGQQSEVMAFSEVRRGHFAEPLTKSNGLQLSDHRVSEAAMGIIDDKVDPFVAGARAEAARLARMGNLSKGEFIANVNHDCPIHGYRDLTKTQNLDNPYGHCICS
jgi:hypothetical protein